MTAYYDQVRRSHDVANGRVDRNNNISVGDYITSYHSGYFVVTDVVQREHQQDHKLWDGDNKCHLQIYNGQPMSSLIFYKKVAKDDGTPMKNAKKKLSCDSSYCKVFDGSRLYDDFKKDMAELHDKYQSLRKVIGIA